MKTDGRKRGKLSRRQFVGAAGAAGAGVAMFTIVPSHVLGAKGDPAKRAPSDKINIAGIGVGGQGGSDVNNVGGENIVGLCDVDDKRGAGSFKKFPNAKRFRDFRKMFDAMDKEIEAVVVGTPDHTHAVASMAAIKRGKHVYCEKPLAHTIHELRELRKAALEHKVITQVGNQGHASEHIRLLCEWVWDGAIGDVTEVHAGTDAFPNVYCQMDKLPKLAERPPVPAGLDWDLWLGPVKARPYQPLYVPWNWRGWTPFGTGAIGDWVCHVVDPAFWALDLGSPKTIQSEALDYDPKKHADVYPRGSKTTFEFPAKGKRGPVKLIWFDGAMRIPRPAELEEGRNAPGTGAVLIGTKGTIMHGSHGAGGCRIIPEAKMKAYKRPEPKIPRVPGHHADWLQAIRQGRQAGSNFEYGGALSEIALLGMIGLRMLGQKIEWDAVKLRFPNCPEADKFVNPPYREGWTL